MSRAELTMKSGAVVTADADEVTLGKNVMSALVRVAWTTPEGARRTLLHVDPAEVAAVVFIRDEDES